MTLLIYAGLLYLFGISVILVLKPDIMFGKDGSWKEFGFGRNKHKYTWMPFWLFAIFWAIISYIIILIVASNTGLAGVSNKMDIPVQVESDNIALNNISPNKMNVLDSSTLNIKQPSKAPKIKNEMKPGYYILDTNETMRQGIPKYIFLGPEAPNLIYHNMDD